MQQQRIPDDRRGTGLSDEEIDNTVIGFVLDGGAWPWSLEEIAIDSATRPMPKTP
jgi:hypothetical protein